MGFKKKFRNKKKNYKRRARRYGRKRIATSIRTRTSALPDTYYTKLNYSELGALNYGGAGAAATYQFRMNSLYDADYTGGGHQPYGFDQLAALYNKYRVYGCKWVVTWSNQSSTYWFDVCTFMRPTADLPTTIQDCLELPYVKRGVLAPVGSSHCTIVQKGYGSINKLYGIGKQQLRIDDIYSSLVNTNPSSTPYLNITCQNQNAGAAATANFRLDCVFYVSFYDRKLLAGS